MESHKKPQEAAESHGKQLEAPFFLKTMRNIILSALFNYTNPAPSDHRKPRENPSKHKENTAKSENFRFLRFFRFCGFVVFLPFVEQKGNCHMAVPHFVSNPDRAGIKLLTPQSLPGVLRRFFKGLPRQQKAIRPLRPLRPL